MSKLSSQRSKCKSSKLKRVAISEHHARNLRKMRNGSTPLRRRFMEDMELHKYSPVTQKHYLSAVVNFCAYYWKPPAAVSDDEIRSYLNYQANDRHLGSGSMGIIHGALLFLYDKTLRLERPTLAIFRTKKTVRKK
jgi:hypothetical protein